MANERLSVIRPIEEVMEEDGTSRQQISSNMSSTVLPSPSLDRNDRRECISDVMGSSYKQHEKTSKISNVV